MRPAIAVLLWFTASISARAQTDPMAAVLARLDRLERDNQELRAEVTSLKTELASLRQGQASATTGEAPLAEAQEVTEHRVAELAQTRVEASQRLPLAITGMLLMNAYWNGKNSTTEDPTVASSVAQPRQAGANIRQTVLGLKWSGTPLPGDGLASGSVYMDFSSGSLSPDNHVLHIRTATLDLSWKNTTFSVGQDKPVIAPREPDSLAQVAVSPLTGAGNLWDWQPQARIEQRFAIGDANGIRAQFGVYQTAETQESLAANYLNTVESARPGYEGRLNFWHRGRAKSRFEIAPGFHASTTHVKGTSVDSRLFSLDGLWRPVSSIEVTGAFFNGRNAAGLGALRQGFSIDSAGNVHPVHSTGGWGQLSVFATERLTFHVFAGAENDRRRDLTGGIPANVEYGGNAMYRLAPNILASFEVNQLRTTYLVQGLRLNNHYDFALAYLF